MIASMIPLSPKTQQEILDKTGKSVYIINTREENRSVLPETEILISTNRLDEVTLEQLPSLKMLYILSAGVETLPFDALKKRKILVSNARGIHGPHMSEHAIAMLTAFSRKICRSVQNQQKHYWEKNQQLESLSGKTLCIIGAGSIGKEIAQKAAVFGMDVIGIKRHAEDIDGFRAIYAMEKLHEILPVADYVILLTPLTKETYHLMGQREFSAMKKEAVFINLSRGDNVDEEALISALQNHEIAGAALDVAHEEPLGADSPLWDMENVLITPHTAGIIPHYVEHAMKMFYPNYDAFMKGETLPTQVDLDLRY